MESRRDLAVETRSHQSTPATRVLTAEDTLLALARAVLTGDDRRARRLAREALGEEPVLKVVE